MRRSIPIAAALLACTALAPHTRAQGTFLLIPDSGFDWISLFDPDTGDLVQEAWVTYADAGITGASTPRAAIQVGAEIWVSDQLQDKIYRWQARFTNPAFLGAIGGLDGPRGMRLIGTTVYVANSGTENGAPGEAIVRFDLSGNLLGSFPVTDPFDVLSFNGNLLISNVTDDNLDRYSTGGAFLGVFHDSDGVTGIDGCQQITTDTAGRVLAAGFSTPFGIYRYSSAGAQLNYWPVGNGNRGVYELPDGKVLFTHATTVSTLDPANGDWVEGYASGGSMQFIHKADLLCGADFNRDGFVSGDDFDSFVAAFELGDPSADYNGDGFVSGDDFDSFVAAFEAGC